MRWVSLQEIDNDLINTFSCNDEKRVEEYFKNEAKINDNYLLNRTRVLLSNKNEIIGFYSLYNDLTLIGKKKAKGYGWDIMQDKYNSFPALRLHYLGLNDCYRGKGMGELLLSEVFKEAVILTAKTGCMFITAEAVNDRAIRFNKKFGFKTLKPQQIKSEPEIMAFRILELL